MALSCHEERKIGVMKEGLITLVLWALLVVLCVAPVMAQGATGAYTIHIDFYSYSCSLDTVQVSLYDQTGHFVGAASSPYGGEVAISFRTSTPTFSLTAKASGRASIWSYTRLVTGSSMINLGSGGDYWISVRMQ